LLSQAGQKAGFKVVYTHLFYDLDPVGDHFGYEVIKAHKPLLNSDMTEDQLKKLGDLYEKNLKKEMGEEQKLRTMGVYAIFQKTEHQ